MQTHPHISLLITSLLQDVIIIVAHFGSVGSIPTAERHVFSACPVWIYIQSNHKQPNPGKSIHYTQKKLTLLPNLFYLLALCQLKLDEQPKLYSKYTISTHLHAVQWISRKSNQTEVELC